MGYESFEVSVADQVAHVTMSRPGEYNSMNTSFWAELPVIVRGLSEGGEARAIVLDAQGKHFCSGMDLAVFGGGEDIGEGDAQLEAGRSRASTRELILALHETFTCLEQARMPVLAAVQGACVGGGIDMISACDMRYATADAFFSIAEIDIGMTADVGTLQRLPKIVPEGIVRELAYTGWRMGAERAAEVGLVNQIFDTLEQMEEGVHDIAAQIARKSPLAVWGTKEMINYTRDHTVADSLNYIATWNAGMLQSADMVESFKAKKARRDPVYDDLAPTRKTL